jgi:hypothetical protein
MSDEWWCDSPSAELVGGGAQATSPYGEEGAAGARETCAALLTSTPAVAALRAFLHAQLSGPTAHTPVPSPSRCVRLRIDSSYAPSVRTSKGT